jgi:hypothetical protein
VLGLFGADDPHDAVAPDDLAVLAHTLHRSSDLHLLFSVLSSLNSALSDRLGGSIPAGTVGDDLGPPPGGRPEVMAVVDGA